MVECYVKTIEEQLRYKKTWVYVLLKAKVCVVYVVCNICNSSN
jgi:hypothetical protein